jgi:hypothetical protein
MERKFSATQIPPLKLTGFWLNMLGSLSLESPLKLQKWNEKTKIPQRQRQTLVDKAFNNISSKRLEEW